MSPEVSDEAQNGAPPPPAAAKIEPIRGTGLLKSVTIHDEPETITSRPFSGSGVCESPTLGDSSSPKLHRASISGKKLIGRPPLNPEASSTSISHQLSSVSLDGGQSQQDLSSGKSQDPAQILSQVVNWLQEEKAKLAGSKQKDDEISPTEIKSQAKVDSAHDKSALDLDKLEQILAGFLASASPGISALGTKGSQALRRRGSIAKKFKRGSIGMSSDTEHQDGDLVVPNVEAVLDNSKTLTKSGGMNDNDLGTLRAKDKEQWISFKCEVIRLTHTLRLKGWRRVPIDRGEDVSIERLSGALTNAVYVVSPPKDLPVATTATDGTTSEKPRRRPAKLLLRIYGPQAEHLIDREGELVILRRLARKKIGPRLLGTFTNGRFEEFFHARTLTPEDLRVPETSKQIAKRMRELHDGIELLPEERDGGPFIWKNWNKWVSRCEQVITKLDEQIIKRQKEGSKEVATKRWMQRGFVCGVEWSVFRKTVENYRKHLEKTHGGKSGIKKQLVFAHNDTQYGNLMRLQPSGESPLLTPSNEHRQLIVIDFEYASANTPGLEFANHFTEWCYNYHHPTSCFSCNTTAYPTPEEQYRFVKSYVLHRSQFNPNASSTPKLTPRDSNISTFMLDSRTPHGASNIDYDAEEKVRQEATEKEIHVLLEETRKWRIANSAQWVAWGIVQAKVPEVDDLPKSSTTSRTAAIIQSIKQRLHPQSDPIDPEVKALQADAKADRPESAAQEAADREGDDDDDDDNNNNENSDDDDHDHEEFDYLAYAQDRAFFFWGDCLQMGFVKEEDLPDELKKWVKVVPY